MPRLTPCRSCHSHVFADERECPHCGANLRSNAALPAVLVGLALAGCPGEPEYGVPDTGTPEETAGKTTETDTGTGTETDTGMETTTAGEPEYGVSET
jgi:hypothetical protein